MKPVVPLMAAAMVLAACSSGPSSPGVRPAQTFTVNYRCDSGELLTIRYFGDQGMAVLTRNGQNIELDRVSNAPLTYAGGQTRVVSDANRAIITINVGMAAPVNCVANNMSGRPPAPPAPPTPVPPPPPPPPPAPPAPAEMRVSYNCDNGEQITVRYFPQQGVASLVRGGQTTELQQQATPPGFTYSGGATTLRVQPDRMGLTMTVGAMASTRCTAA